MKSNALKHCGSTQSSTMRTCNVIICLISSLQGPKTRAHNWSIWDLNLTSPPNFWLLYQIIFFIFNFTSHFQVSVIRNRADSDSNIYNYEISHKTQYEGWLVLEPKEAMKTWLREFRTRIYEREREREREREIKKTSGYGQSAIWLRERESKKVMLISQGSCFSRVLERWLVDSLRPKVWSMILALKPMTRIWAKRTCYWTLKFKN